MVVYLDYAAMSPPFGCASAVYNAKIAENALIGNPSSEHFAGWAARQEIERARQEIAEIMECAPKELYFTATATEAAALAIKSAYSAGYAVEASPFEHHAISENVEFFKPLQHKETVGTAHCSMLLNNETGEYIRHPHMMQGDMWICDATAAVGHVPVSFRKIGCDYMIADGIKFGGVPGAAFLIAGKNAPLSPLWMGGGQERGIRSGTENMPAICAMAAALKNHDCMSDLEHKTLDEIRRIFIAAFMKIKGSKPLFNSAITGAPHIVNVSFPGVESHALSVYLSKRGIMISPGAACSNGLHEPSHVIMAKYHDAQRAACAVRISFSSQTTKAEAEFAAKEIVSAVETLREME